MEAEYMALSDAAREALARRQLFEELHISSASKSVTILTNNQIALNISENPANYRQAKHIDIHYHAIKHYIHDRKIEIDYISFNYQLADIFTKALENPKHLRFCQMMDLRNNFEAFENVELIRNLEDYDDE